MLKKPFALIILDGWGYREETAYNPTRLAATPTIDALFSQYPHLLIEASGIAVGLPEGQMGNSEVGHLHIGAGRKVPQDLVRINTDIKNGAFFNNPVLIQAIQKAKTNHKAVHILGLVSDGGVHSHIDHLCAAIEMVHALGVTHNYFHAICDGRDTPPQSALPFIQRIEKLYEQNKSGQIASVIGRYFAMDRDKRWDRTEKAYDLLTGGTASYSALTAVDALEAAYARGETDEFVKPTLVGTLPITVNDQDVVLFFNFRADRARQLSYAFVDADFKNFSRKKWPQLSEFITMTQYADTLQASVLFSPQFLHNTLGEFLSTQGLTQLRLAETEKYAHVTYFLNGGEENAFPGETRWLVPSPRVATYDLQPEMSAKELTDQLVKAIESREFDVIICNYANPDMIGHTGDEKAAEIAVTTIDHCLKRVMESLKKSG